MEAVLELVKCGDQLAARLAAAVRTFSKTWEPPASDASGGAAHSSWGEPPTGIAPGRGLLFWMGELGRGLALSPWWEGPPSSDQSHPSDETPVPRGPGFALRGLFVAVGCVMDLPISAAWFRGVRVSRASGPALRRRPSSTLPADPRRKAPSADGWIHEIKHDGFRLQIHVRGARVRLYTMTGVDWTERYPWIVQDVARLNVDHAIIDAECCCDGDDGVTDFDRLHARVNDASAFAYAFDLLAIDGQDMRGGRWRSARPGCAKLLRKAKPGIRLSEPSDRARPDHLRARLQAGPRGHRVEAPRSPYRSGKAKLG